MLDMRDAFFNSLYNYIASDDNVIILTADHGAFGLKRIELEYPKQYLNIGISEQALIGIAAGLAKSGKKVYVYAINNFVSLRVIEQINIDICAMNLDVNIIGVGAGFTYSTDGPTHHGIQDVSLMLNLPNLSVYNVTDATSTRKITELSYKETGPKYIRIEKGYLPCFYNDKDDISLGFKEIISEGDIGIISTGYMTSVVGSVCKELKKENIDIAHLDLTKIKPLPLKKIVSFCSNRRIIVVEENIKSGGIGEKIAAILQNQANLKTFLSIAIEDIFVFDYGSREFLQTKNQIDKETIKNKVRKIMLHDKKEYISIDQEKVCEILSVKKGNLTKHTQKIISEFCLSYRHLSKVELEKALHTILSKSQDKKKIKSGEARKLDWERGWQENLEEYSETLEEKNLKPKYYRPEQYARMHGTYIKPLNKDFVFKFSRILQSQVYGSILKNVDNIYEFGCGSGHNLEFLQKLFGEKKLIGLDWSTSAIKLVNLLSKKISHNITGQMFDFFDPWKNNFSVMDNSAFITMGGLEQVGERHEKFINFILEKKPSIVINIEPIQEFYDKTNLSDFIAFSYHEQRNYLKGYYTKLTELQENNSIEILSTQKVNFGGLFHDGWSVLVWRPI
tara:strand:- start:3000 stop:4859 length:1860 start_codon:yes stop_codon:yes gene_type:complete